MNEVANYTHAADIFTSDVEASRDPLWRLALMTSVERQQKSFFLVKLNLISCVKSRETSFEHPDLHDICGVQRSLWSNGF